MAMTIKEKIEDDFTRVTRNLIRLRELGRKTFQILSPFEFEDGDGIVAFIELSEDKIRFTDKGHTLMHVSYDVDITAPTREKILDRILATYGLESDEGTIYTEAPINDFGLAFWDFIQGIIRISDISQWKFERAKSLFLEEFESFMETVIKANVKKVTRNWYKVEIDPNGYYSIPWVCENGKLPLFVFPIKNNDDCSQTVLSCIKYKHASYKFESLAVFQDIDDKIKKRNRNQCIDEVNKLFSNFSSKNREDAEEYILTHV